MLARRRVCFSRFVPPWVADGSTPEAFFGGVMRSSNPILRNRRDKARVEAESDRLETEEALADEACRSQREAAAAMHLKAEKQMTEFQNFLPYGAEPRKYFSATDMAAWGEYVGCLSSAPYSADTVSLLQHDMDTVIPYKYTTLPSPTRGTQWPLHGTAGVVLDIDGVVYRSKKIISGSDEAIRLLHELKIPFCFMTNGGGFTEAERAAQLSQLLMCPICEDQIIMAHSPLHLLAPRYARKNVLILGPENCCRVAQRYGFDGAISSEEFMRQHPELVPLRDWPEGTPLSPRGTVPYPEIDAVFQFTDAANAFHDIQLVLDVLTSPHGRIGKFVSREQTVPFFNSADDLLWATDAPLPRLGQGAFREMLASVFESVTGTNMQVVQLGKPRAIAYAYAERRLASIASRLGWNSAEMRNIFMVGDNLETDIIGANARGGKWVSVHVLSGVGRAPAAKRTLAAGDEECEWLEEHVSKTPHYIAPTLDHFVRELLAFKQEHMLTNKKPFFGPPCPVNLSEVYGF